MSNDEEYYDEEEYSEDEEFQDHEEGHSEEIDYDDYLRAQRITLEDVKEHITGPVISIVFHIILIPVLATVVVFQPQKGPEDIEVDVSEVEIKEIEEIPEPPEPPEEIPEEVVDVQIDAPAVSTMETTVDVESTVSDMAAENVEIEVDMPDVLTLKETESALKLPRTFSARVGAARGKALRKYGGSSLTEKSVMKALRWLKKVQNEDGSWGTGSKNANTNMQPVFTSMALLAFLAHGETPMSAEFGECIVRGIKVLLEMADDMAYHRRRYVPGPTYTHPIMVYALAEAYGLTKMGKVKRALEYTITPLIKHINTVKSAYGTYSFTHGPYDDRIWRTLPKGVTFQRSPITGRYPRERPDQYVEYQHSDLTFSCWNYQALKAAYAAGCDVEGLEETIQKCIKGLKDSKALGFVKSDFTYTCLGALCLGLFGEGDSKEAKRCNKFIKDFNKKQLTECNWKYDPEIMKIYPKTYLWAIYTWYYQTQVLFQVSKGKGPLWTRWNRAFSKMFVREQERDGSFLSPAEKYGKGVIQDGTAAEWRKVLQFKNDIDLRLYCTTYACLTLEVYYRYLPTYKLERDPAGPRKKAQTGLDDNELDSDIF